jgi:aryl-alcohol dehydrogenase-like predicted oxidoreductase
MDTRENSERRPVTRRRFLARSAGGLGLLLAPKLLRAEEKAEGGFDPFEAVPLGRTGLKVCRVGFGTGTKGWMRQSNQTRMGKERFEALLRAAFDKGVRLFDCADLYGTHHHVASALKGIPRDQYVLVTKVWWLKTAAVPEPERPPVETVVERFLKELGTDYIDIVQLHAPVSPKWPAELKAQMDALEALKKKGVLRAHGISSHSIEALLAAADEPWVDSVHARINPFNIMMDGPLDKVVAALKKLHDAGKGVIGMKIMGEGRLRDSDEKRDQSVDLALNLGSVDAMIVGFEKPEEIDDFAARVRKVKRKPADAKP